MQGGALSGGVCPSTGRRIGGVPSRGKRSARIVPPSTRPADSGSPLRHAGLKPKRGTIVLPHRFFHGSPCAGRSPGRRGSRVPSRPAVRGKMFRRNHGPVLCTIFGKSGGRPRGLSPYRGRVPNPSRRRKRRALFSASPPNRTRAPGGSPARRGRGAVVAVKAPLKKDFRQAWLFHCRLSSLPPKKQKTGQALSPALFRFGLGEYYYYPLARAFSRSVSCTMKFHESRHISSIVRVASQPSSFFAFDTSA